MACSSSVLNASTSSSVAKVGKTTREQASVQQPPSQARPRVLVSGVLASASSMTLLPVPSTAGCRHVTFCTWLGSGSVVRVGVGVGVSVSVKGGG